MISILLLYEALLKRDFVRALVLVTYMLVRTINKEWRHPICNMSESVWVMPESVWVMPKSVWVCFTKFSTAIFSFLFPLFCTNERKREHHISPSLPSFLRFKWLPYHILIVISVCNMLLVLSHCMHTCVHIFLLFIPWSRDMKVSWVCARLVRTKIRFRLSTIINSEKENNS